MGEFMRLVKCPCCGFEIIILLPEKGAEFKCPSCGYKIELGDENGNKNEVGKR